VFVSTLRTSTPSRLTVAPYPATVPAARFTVTAPLGEVKLPYRLPTGCRRPPARRPNTAAALDVERVVAVQAAQVHRDDAARVQHVRHVRNLDHVCRLVDVEYIAVVGAVQFERVLAAVIAANVTLPIRRCG